MRHVLLPELPTPQVLVDRLRLERNILRMQEAVSAGGMRLRPHVKTHKSPWIARQQTAAGAIGITCAKLGEAEVFARAGFGDIRVAYPVQPLNAGRIGDLLDRCRVSIVIDDPGVAADWSRELTRLGRTLDVLVKVDVGFHRCGIDPRAADAADVVARMAGLPGLRLRGLLSHAGHAYQAGSPDDILRIARDERDILCGLAGELRALGVEVGELSVGSTPSARASAALEGLTEMRCGNYVFYDRTQVGLGAAMLDDCALTVLATVVSRPARDRLILDCGSKTLTNDGARGFGAAHGFGLVLPATRANEPDESLTIERLSEEHATVHAAGGRTSLRPGDRVRVLPNHACVVANMVDELLLVDDEIELRKLPVAARGCIR